MSLSSAGFRIASAGFVDGRDQKNIETLRRRNEERRRLYLDAKKRAIGVRSSAARAARTPSPARYRNILRHFCLRWGCGRQGSLTRCALARDVAQVDKATLDSQVEEKRRAQEEERAEDYAYGARPAAGGAQGPRLGARGGGDGCWPPRPAPRRSTSRSARPDMTTIKSQRSTSGGSGRWSRRRSGRRSGSGCSGRTSSMWPGGSSGTAPFARSGT